MTPEQAIGMLNLKAAAAHRAYLESIAARDGNAKCVAHMSRHNALLDAIEIVRQIHAEETSHV